MVAILIVGVGHCGTTILRRIIGAHSCVHEIVTEMIPTIEHVQHKNQVYIYKAPIYNWNKYEMLNTFLQIHDVKVIHISRNFECIQNSIRKRFANRTDCLYEEHVLKDVFKQLHDRDDFIQVNYEDLVADPEGFMKTMCQKINISYEKNMLEYHNKKCVTSNIGNELYIPNERPLDIEHDLLRIWQINQPLYRV